MEIVPHYFESPKKIVGNLNDALGRLESKGNLLSLSDFKSRMPSVLDRFLDYMMKINDGEILERGEFYLLQPVEMAAFHFGRGHERVGSLLFEQGFCSRESSNVYERLRFFGGEEMKVKGKNLSPFCLDFYAQYNGRNTIRRNEFVKKIKLNNNFVEDVFPNECFVRQGYLDKVNK